jgi:lysozyme family protein
MTPDLSRLGSTMTDFMTAFNKALSNEGYISSNPADKGGFTYKGISRIKHPTWPGWKIKDSIYRSTDLSRSRDYKSVQQLYNNTALQTAVTNFYRTEFWNKIQGDLLPSQLIADELFDSSINLGVPVASEFLQKTINLLNRNTNLYPDITVDGIIGSQTLSALNKCMSANGEKLLFNLLNFYQAKRYIEIMERDRTQEIFIGWFNRIEVVRI